MTTVFTPIILGQSDTQRVFWEDDTHVAFLTHHPHTRGHTLVVPKKEYKTYMDMPEGEYVEYMRVCKKMSDVLNEIFNPVHIGMEISGFEVPHVHVHLIPANSLEDMQGLHSYNATQKELEEVSDFIKSKILFLNL